MSSERRSEKKSKKGVGFRNVLDFNVAMVGKQGWRLMLYQNSLAVRIYKAHYCSNDFFSH